MIIVISFKFQTFEASLNLDKNQSIQYDHSLIIISTAVGYISKLLYSVTVRRKFLAWEKIASLVNRMPFINVLPASYFP